jgi:hypothetical protein
VPERGGDQPPKSRLRTQAGDRHSAALAELTAEDHHAHLGERFGEGEGSTSMAQVGDTDPKMGLAVSAR